MDCLVCEWRFSAYGFTLLEQPKFALRAASVCTFDTRWAMGFFFPDLELRMELRTVITGVSRFDVYVMLLLRVYGPGGIRAPD